MATDEPQDLDAGAIGQPLVEQHEVVRLVPHPVDGLGPVARLVHEEAGRAQRVGERAAEQRFVVDDEDSVGHRSGGGGSGADPARRAPIGRRKRPGT